MKVLRETSAAAQTAALAMDSVQALLTSCVRGWDRHGRDGAVPAETLRHTCAREGVEVDVFAEDEACSKQSLAHLVTNAAPSQHAAPSQFGVLITGIPATASNSHQSQLGDTFLFLKLEKTTAVIDSHRHATSSSPGTVIAVSVDAAEIIEWIFNVLLLELSCSQQFVTATAFSLKLAPLGGDMSLGQWARQQRQAGSSAAKQSPAAARSAAPAEARSRQPQPQQLVECALVASGSDGWGHTCSKFVAKCAQCLWHKHKQQWQKLSSLNDPDSGRLIAPIVEKPRLLGGDWGIGCVRALELYGAARSQLGCSETCYDRDGAALSQIN